MSLYYNILKSNVPPPDQFLQAVIGSNKFFDLFNEVSFQAFSEFDTSLYSSIFVNIKNILKILAQD